MSGLSQIADEVVAYLEPIAEGLEFPASLTKLLDQIGAVNGSDAALVAALTTIVDFGQQCETLASQSQPSFEAAASLLELSRQAFSALSALTDAGGTVAGVSSLGEDLAELLASIWLVSRHPRFYSLGVLLSLIQADWDQTLSADRPNAAGNDLVRYGFTIDRLRPSRIVDLIRDPVGTLRAEYASPLATDADAFALADKLFPRLQILFSQLGLVSRYGISAADAADLKDWAAPMSHALIVYVQSVARGDSADAGVVVTISPASQGDLGLVFALFGNLNVTQPVGPWTLAALVTAGVDVVAWGRNGPALLASGAATELAATVTASLPAPAQGPAHVFGSPAGTRLEIGGATASAAAHLVQTGSSLAFNVDVTKSKLVIAGGDSFVSSLLPDNGLEANFNLGIGWSSDTGLTLRGSAGLQTDVPVSLSVGGVTLSQLYLALQAGNAGVTGEISGILSASIGPVRVTIDRVGIAANLTFPGKGGNLGGGELAVGFKPPFGLGISVGAAVVSGGGFLEHKGDEYGGALDLAMEDIAVKAYGALQTKLPGGVPGYSFIIALSTEFIPAIQLPFGFSLDGVGGIVGINRTIAVDAIESALWAHHLDGLLFPKELIASAPQLITALDSYFPPADGRYLIGPMAKIGWGDGIVEGEIALLLELPEPLKLLLLGEIEVDVPMEKPQLELHISFDGGLDFGKKLAFFDATLHDSRIESFPIIGDLAFRDGWGDDGSFALALGGFNPHFQPPASFPTLKRLAITIGSSVAQIEAQAYIALTANTLQFGARAEVTAGTGSFNVHGWLGIDALCERHPMSFIFDLSGGIDLRHGTDVLASVHLDGHLSGPTPWHISGEASLSLFLFDVSVHFDKSWGHAADALSLPDPLSLLLAALADLSSFRSVLPPGVRAIVSVAGAAADANQALLLEPAGTLRIAQRVLPFGQPLTRFGGAPLGRTVQFTMDGVTAFTTTFQQPPTTTEEFAPAQYFEFSDAEKLSLPSFSKFDAGVEIAGDATDIGSGSPKHAVVTQLTYDTTIFDSVSQKPGKTYMLGIGALLAMNGRAMAQPTGLGRYAPPAGIPSRVSLAPDRWVIAGVNDLALRADITSDGSKVGAQLALNRFLAANADQRGQLQVVLLEEAA